MSSAIVVHPSFDGTWPYAAEAFARRWAAEGPVSFVRLAHGDDRPLGQAVPDPAACTRLIALQVPVTAECLAGLPLLAEAAFVPLLDEPLAETLTQRGVAVYRHTSEGFWGQSVAEFGLALTLCGLRRIPQTHHAILTDHAPWHYGQPRGEEQPGRRGLQFGDDPAFTNGTVAGKRVRVVGAGNIGSRYASFCAMLGADVAIWDPFAPEPNFHRAGARREHHLDALVADAEVFAPMLPLRDATRGLVTSALIDALPAGCLVVMVTRARICDTAAVRRRVLAGELALAADVFDREPLPLDDPLLGLPNVVHTPHNAGRTRHANEEFAAMLLAQFRPR